jgi:hypothetical protein
MMNPIDTTLPSRLHADRSTNVRADSDMRCLLEYLAGDVDRYLQLYDGDCVRVDQMRELANIRTRLREIKVRIAKSNGG